MGRGRKEPLIYGHKIEKKTHKAARKGADENYMIRG